MPNARLLILIIGFFLTSPLTVYAAIPSQDEISKTIKVDMANRSGSSFFSLLKRWELKFGASAVSSLIELAADIRQTDADRYVAIMGAAKLGGPDAGPLLTRLLKDRSWMIRSGALKALKALRNPITGGNVLPLLKDPALVVRLEAVDAVSELKPTGAVEAIIEVLQRQENYHGGKAQWVPQRALAALVKLQAKDAAPRLLPLLKHQQDREIQHLTIRTLETLTGRKIKSDQSLKVQISAWEDALRLKS